MIAFAEDVIRDQLSSAGPSSPHLELARRYGREVKIKLPEPPALFAHIWGWFLDLSSQRTMGFDAPEPIQYSEILAWMCVTETPIADHELRLLIAMDRIYLREARRARERNRKKR